MSTFKTVVPQPVMWGDMDAFQHVNNVIYLRYFETARIKYFNQLGGSETFSGNVKPIIASVTANYKQPVVFPDTLQIHVGVTKIGNASMTMGCEMYSEKGYLAFVGECTFVMYDVVKSKPVGIPKEMRDLVYAIDGDVPSK